MSYRASLIFIFLVTCTLCESVQYVRYRYANNYEDAYGGAYGQSVDTDNVQSTPCKSSCGESIQNTPCKSSCGNYQPISYCNHMPCYYQPRYVQQPYYTPYAYTNNKRIVVQNYPAYQRVVVPRIKPSSSSYSDAYTNVPVQIIDDDTISVLPISSNRQIQPAQDIYANVQTEIIDDDDAAFASYWQKIPALPKRPRISSTNSYSVSHGQITSKSVSQNPPIRATVTRTFPPQPQEKPVSQLDFLNGVPVNNIQPSKETTVQEEIITTETPTGTTDENEEVPEVDSWLSFK